MNTLQFSWPNGLGGAVTTSWDDGTRHDRRLVEILNRHGLKGTWNLNSRRVQSGNREAEVQADEAAALFAGHEIACHSYSHPWLGHLPDGVILAEMLEDRRLLEAVAGYPVRGMSLPYGQYDQRVLRLLREAGMLHNRTTRRTGNFALPDDFLEWHPTCHHKEDLTDLWQRFQEARIATRLLYVWGHSYEFDRDNNWDHIEAFAELAGGADDVWHATNMEVYLYVTAWQQLWTSVDLSAIHNPSAQSLWFRVNGKLQSCGPGESHTLSAAS